MDPRWSNPGLIYMPATEETASLRHMLFFMKKCCIAGDSFHCLGDFLYMTPVLSVNTLLDVVKILPETILFVHEPNKAEEQLCCVGLFLKTD